MAADSATLMDGAKCIQCGIPPGMQGAVIIYLLAKYANMSADPATLMDGAKCIQCGIPPGMMSAVMINLLNTIASGGGGGGGGNAPVVYTNDPNAEGLTPTNTALPALAYSSNGAGAIFGWSVNLQIWV